MSRTTHTLIASDARRLSEVLPAPPSLILTSPPYPMITMWDDSFADQSPAIKLALAAADGQAAFDAMHEILDSVWSLSHEVLLDGGLICVNIGDAVRTLDGEFGLYANASRVTAGLRHAGFTLLPQIIWRKPGNSPTKFMGSGMLPGGAYVTLEHELIVIGRKGGLRRPASQEQREVRRQSAIFWEERNEWYSDLWTLSGVRQELGTGRKSATVDRGDPSQVSPARDGGGRKRSAAFPFELAYRLIAMHSWNGDLVVDPFAGTGTTATAAMALGRSSFSLDRDPQLVSNAAGNLSDEGLLERLRLRTSDRLEAHRSFVRERNKPPAHHNHRYNTPVVTAQETDLVVPLLSAINADRATLSVECEYESE